METASLPFFIQCCFLVMFVLSNGFTASCMITGEEFPRLHVVTFLIAIALIVFFINMGALLGTIGATEGIITALFFGRRIFFSM